MSAKARGITQLKQFAKQNAMKLRLYYSTVNAIKIN
jgi:hypothetical protein